MNETIRFPVAGMTCASCVSRITRALRNVDAVSIVRVDLRHETATVRRVPDAVSNDAIALAIAGAGYTADFESATVLPAEEGRGFLGRLFPMTIAHPRARGRSRTRASAPTIGPITAESEPQPPPETLVVGHVFIVAEAGDP